MKTTYFIHAMGIQLFLAILFPLSSNAQKASPIGSIMAFAGTEKMIPGNWRVCNGDTLHKKEFSKLYEKIDSLWGKATNPKYFKLPDLRGMFLRGVNGTRNDNYADPDTKTRYSTNGSNYVNEAGSVQDDALKSHIHRLKSRRSGIGISDALSLADTDAIAGHNGNSEWDDRHMEASSNDQETRPVNAYIYWIIRVK